VPLGIIAEAVLRLEHKVDLLLTHLKVPVKPMHFVGNSCPVCKQANDFYIDVVKNIVSKRCGCSTGKQPSVFPLLPVGVQPNAALPRSAQPEAEESSGAEDRRRSEGR
jgi:hypothetical protein